MSRPLLLAVLLLLFYSFTLFSPSSASAPPPPPAPPLCPASQPVCYVTRPAQFPASSCLFRDCPAAGNVGNWCCPDIPPTPIPASNDCYLNDGYCATAIAECADVGDTYSPVLQCATGYCCVPPRPP